jgi:hypothetical protein
MARIDQTLFPITRLQLALRLITPTRVAQTFAAFAGQFYDRSDFDSLARQVSQFYDLESDEHAHLFRSQLDRCLCDRIHDPAAWDVDARGKEHAP